MTVWIETELCNGCQRCVRKCPYGAVEMRDGVAYILEHCTSCGTCIEVCKPGAIMTDVEPRAIPDFSDFKGVWVLAEHKKGTLNPVSLELLGKARDLAGALNEEVSVLVIGHGVSKFTDTLMEYGAQKIYLAEHEALEAYRTLPYTRVVEELVGKYKPNILLIGATLSGRDLAPRVSRRIGVGLTADCTELSIDPDEKILLQTRPAFGGNVMATIANRYSRPQMATVRPGVMEAKQSPGNKAEVIKHEVSFIDKDLDTRILEVLEEEKKGFNLSEAKTIVAGGRGMGDGEGFKVLEELASLLGGEVAGTRVAVEEGWIPVERQIGQTGQSVRPELYVACGISGAIQHRAGMMNARFVVAINRDPRAPIFQVADWGIVGDVREVLPEMIGRLKEK